MQYIIIIKTKTSFLLQAFLEYLLYMHQLGIGCCNAKEWMPELVYIIHDDIIYYNDLLPSQIHFDYNYWKMWVFLFYINYWLTGKLTHLPTGGF